MTRRALATLVALGAASTVVAMPLTVAWPWLTREPVGPAGGPLPLTVEGGSEPTKGQFVGHTESDIADRFGQPTHRWRGHYGSTSVSYQRKYPDAVTATYVRDGGVQYLSFCKSGGRLVCFSSHWMPEGVVF